MCAPSWCFRRPTASPIYRSSAPRWAWNRNPRPRSVVLSVGHRTGIKNMTVAKFVQPDFLTQTAAAYKAAIDAAIAVLATVSGDYACHAKDTPDMQVLVDAGQLFLADRTLVRNAHQTPPHLTAPVH